MTSLIELGYDAEVRTRQGSWRFVVAVYSDETLGTIPAHPSRTPGRFTVLSASRIVEIRPATSGS